jgi:MYXO-CTERM domain-containing protein
LRWLYIDHATIRGVNSRGISSVVGLALVCLLFASSAAAAQPVRGFATYKITLSYPMGQRSVLLNESSAPSDRAGYSDLVLELIGTQQNLTYSRLVNASDDFLPYLPSIAPQSLNYSSGAMYSLHASVTASGTKDVMFQGSQYTANVLTISFAASFGNRSLTGTGTVETFPSALVYSASFGASLFKLDVVLVATDLPLTLPDSPSPAAAYVGAGVGMGAAALGGAFLIRRRERKTKQPEGKPLHWVD